MSEQFKWIVELMKSALPSRMKGKTVMWWITANVIAMCWYVTLHYKDGARLDGAVSIVYGIAIGAFAGNKITETLSERRSSSRVESSVKNADGSKII